MADDNKWQLIPLCFSTTDYMHSSTPYHPHGAPIFPIRQTQQLFPQETSCCVKKKHARQTTARPYIQSVRSSTSRSFFTPYSQTQHNLSPPRSQKSKTSSRRATRIQNPRPPRAAQPEPITQDLLVPRDQNPEPRTFQTLVVRRRRAVTTALLSLMKMVAGTLLQVC